MMTEISRRKPFNHLAGYIASRRNDINGAYVVIYDAEAQDMDTYGGRYISVCEAHATVANHTSLPKARPTLRIPDFCEACMAELNGEQLDPYMADIAAESEANYIDRMNQAGVPAFTRRLN